jgi:hypothetical protein
VYSKNGNSVADYFGDATKGLYPGARASVAVQLRNNTADMVSFYLRAEALTGEAARGLEAAFDGKVAIDALLENIDITVTHGGAAIYRGTLGGSASGTAPDLYTTGAFLGRVSPGYWGNVAVELTVRDLDNTFVDALCAVTWVFEARQEDDVVTPTATPTPTVPPGGGGPSVGGTPTAVTAEVVADATPTATAAVGAVASATPTAVTSQSAATTPSATTEIPDDDTPLGGVIDDGSMTDSLGDEIPDMIVVPITGDRGGGFLTYGTVAAVALVAMVALLVIAPGKRKKA